MNLSTSKVPVVPKYRVIEKLGEGGMASVWLAQREQSDQLSVIKILHEHLASDRVVQNRFLREAQVAALLDHPCIARLFDAGVSDDASYLAMEFIAGMDLESVMFKLWDQRKLPPPELSISITLRMLEGLHYAHEFKDSNGTHLEIVHRDLSPRNLMLTFDGEVKIIDFGLVRTNLGDFRTAPGMIAGTLRYMSPEQATAEKIDRRSDIYTWAVVLYELLTGLPLVKATEARTILGAVVVDVPPPLSQRNPNLPKGLDAVLARALEKDAQQRFPTAEEFRVALAMAAGELGVVKKETVGSFVGALFPAERAAAIGRREVTMELAAVLEPTRAGAPLAEPVRFAEPMEAGPMFEPTRAVSSAAFRASRPRAKLPYILVSLAVLVVSVALFVLDDEPEKVESVPTVEDVRPPPLAVPTVAPVTEPIEPVNQHVVRPKIASRRSKPPQPPPPRSPPVAVDEPATEFVVEVETKKFEREVRSKLGDKEASSFFIKCGAGGVISRYVDDPVAVQKTLAQCRDMMSRDSR